jgi:hypothetical protein
MYSCPTRRLFYLALLLPPAYCFAIQVLPSAVVPVRPLIRGELASVGDLSGISAAASPVLTSQEHVGGQPTGLGLASPPSPDTTYPPPQTTLLVTYNHHHDPPKPRHPPSPILTPRQSPTDPPGNKNDNENNRPLGVEIGLGVGIPFIVAAFAYLCCKCHCRPAQRPADDGKRTGRRLVLPISNSRPVAYPLAPLHPSCVPAAVRFGPPPMVPPPAYGEEGSGVAYHPLEGEVGYYPPPPPPPPPERVRTPPPVYFSSAEPGRLSEGDGMDGLEVADVGVGRGEGLEVVDVGGTATEDVGREGNRVAR